MKNLLSKNIKISFFKIFGAAMIFSLITQAANAESPNEAVKRLGIASLKNKSADTAIFGQISLKSVYAGNHLGCERSLVMKDFKNEREIYNYKNCGKGAKFIGKTGVEELSNAAKGAYIEHKDDLMSDCMANGSAKLEVDGFVFVCARGERRGGTITAYKGEFALESAKFSLY